MYSSDLPKLLNDNMSESRKLNYISSKNYSKTINDLKNCNLKLNDILTKYKDHEMRAQVLKKKNEKTEDRERKTVELNYDYYKENYSNWVEGIKTNIIEKEKMRSTSNGQKLVCINKNEKTSYKKVINQPIKKRNDSSYNLNGSEEKMTLDFNLGQMPNLMLKESKNEEELETEIKKNLNDIKNDSSYNFWKFNNEENDSLLKKIYDKKLILDLKLVKDAHTEHLERLKCKTEMNGPNLKYLKEKIEKTKEKILFIKGIVDYAFPKIMIEKARSVEKLIRSKSGSNQKYLNTEKDTKMKTKRIFITKSSSGFYGNINYRSVDRNTLYQNQSQNQLIKTFSKIKISSKNLSPNIKLKVYTPLKITSFSPIMN